MIILITVFWSLFFYSMFARLLRWLSIWQQKEYRIDRFISFLKSDEGRAELKKILIFPIRKNQIKRPAWTKKMVFIALTAFLILLSIDWNNSFVIAAVYVLIPLFVVFSSLPAIIITWLTLSYYEYKASRKIKKFKPIIIGVSGSYGKTTTKILIKQMLSSKYEVWMSPKSHNTPLSIAMAINSSYKGQSIIILEYASYKKGEISHLTKLYPPQIGVFTGINNQHLALFGGWDAMLKAETELFESLPANAPLFYNSNDINVNQLVKKFSHLKPIPSKENDIINSSLTSKGFLKISFEKTQDFIISKLLGKHYLENISLALSVTKHLKVNLKDQIDAIKSFEPGEEFIRLIQTKKGINLLIDDRTSNLDGVLAVINLAKHIEANKKILVTGGIVDLGTQSRESHQKISNSVKNVFDQIWYTSNLESETIALELGDKYYSITSVDQLIDQPLNQLNANDLVVIEGKLPKDIDKYIRKNL